MPAFVLLGWVLVTPFAVAAAIGASGAARRAIARAHPLPVVLGWAGVVLLVGGALALPASPAMLVGAPLTGLAIWWPRSGGGGDDDGEDDPPPDDQPHGPLVDWDAFERDFREYARRQDRRTSPR